MNNSTCLKDESIEYFQSRNIKATPPLTAKRLPPIYLTRHNDQSFYQFTSNSEKMNSNQVDLKEPPLPLVTQTKSNNLTIKKLFVKKFTPLVLNLLIHILLCQKSKF